MVLSSGQDDFKQVYQAGLGKGTDTGAPPAEPLTGRAKRKARRARRNAAAPPPTYSETSATPYSGRTGTGTTASPGQPSQGAVDTGVYNPGDLQVGHTGYHNQGLMPNVATMPGPFANKNTAFGITAAQDPYTFFGTELGPGNEGGYANQFYAQTYDPYNLSVALGRSPLDNDVLNFGHQLAQQLMGQAGMGKMMDPMSIIASVFKIAGSANLNDPGSGPLAAIATMNPSDAFRTFMTVLQGAVGGLLPEESMKSLQAMMQMYFAQYMQQWGGRPLEDQKNQSQNVISYIASKLGPNFGIY
jgi:hypothetical protein